MGRSKEIMARQIENLGAKLAIVAMIANRVGNGEIIKLNSIYETYNTGCWLWASESQFVQFVTDQLKGAGCYVKSVRKGGTIVSAEEIIEIEITRISHERREEMFCELYEAVIIACMSENGTINVTKLVDDQLLSSSFTGGKQRFMTKFGEEAQKDERIKVQAIRKAGTFICPAGQEIDLN
jgi:hypothetical protein